MNGSSPNLELAPGAEPVGQHAAADEGESQSIRLASFEFLGRLVQIVTTSPGEADVSMIDNAGHGHVIAWAKWTDAGFRRLDMSDDPYRHNLIQANSRLQTDLDRLARITIDVSLFGTAMPDELVDRIAIHYRRPQRR
ncbi:hypothetical protein [Salininema proteolyticum]|uniref:Uncharacterized protein n=1 Tax=Salininema proteolyticum TaxID=1607685 RepID=A0ABV8TUA9_9ACTN